jgi:hypothetical protein
LDTRVVLEDQHLADALRHLACLLLDGQHRREVRGGP